MVNLVICGGGNGAHVLAGLAGQVPGVHVCILTIADEVAKINAGIKISGGIHVHGPDGQGGMIDVKAAPNQVESDMGKCIPDADIIILTIPAFVHEKLLTSMQPYLKQGAVIVGMPGRPGFEFSAKASLKEKWDTTSVITLVTLPWACRIDEYGQSVHVIGTKVVLDGAALIKSATPADLKPVDLIQKLLGPRPIVQCEATLLTISLMNINGMVHPGILYGEWANWDGKPVETVPLFYQGMTQETADRMDLVNHEIASIGQSLGFTKMLSALQIYINFYDDQLKDTSSLFTAITSNTAYEGLKHPVTETADGKFLPNFDYRYLTEDLPYGLCVVKGFAELAGVPTPTVDLLLSWSQAKINKEYLTSDGKLAGKDVCETRAPQRYGIKTREELLAYDSFA